VLHSGCLILPNRRVRTRTGVTGNASNRLTGTADELDRDLPATIVNFVSAHLELKNTLDRAKAEIDAAAKAAQPDARSKSKSTTTKPTLKPEGTKPIEPAKPAPQTPPDPARAASLFDAPAPALASTADTNEEEEILSETAEEDQVTEEIDEAA